MDDITNNFDPVTGEPLNTAPAMPTEPIATHRKRPGIFRKIIAFLLSMILTVLILVGLLTFFAKNLITKEGLTSAGMKVMDVPISSFVSEKDSGFLKEFDLDKDATVEDVIVAVTKDSLNDKGIKSEEIEDFLDSKSGQKFLSDTLGVVLDQILSDSEENGLKDSIIDYVQDNKDFIEDNLKIKITAEDIRNLEKTLEQDDVAEVLNTISDASLSTITGTTLENDRSIKDVFETIESLIRLTQIVVLIAGIVIILLLLLVLWDLPTFARYTGVPCIISGGLVTITVLLLGNYITDLIRDNLTDNLSDVVGSFVETTLEKNIAPGLITLITGVVLLFLGIVSAVIINAMVKSKAKKQTYMM